MVISPEVFDISVAFLTCREKSWQEEAESETLGKSCPGLPRNSRLCTVLPAVVLESTNGSVHIEMTLMIDLIVFYHSLQLLTPINPFCE